ncbi:MAG: alkaline phosphatase [Gordonia sp. (in: high G+C Gram-positive bacteria)]|uniref:alkaline phosphatase n=1 Tax=Gordonia sp. (in: high G+C Gram-positive bacteria) TaxID=84139 RepID=UPI0039E61205
MDIKGATLKSAILVSAVALSVAGCGSDPYPGGTGDEAAGVKIQRDAKGNPRDNGGARRLNKDQAEAIADSLQRSGAKNVILLIGDGTSDQEYTIARNYQWGAGGIIPGVDELPLTGSYTTYSLDKDTGKPNYTTDSAASGTALATGTKTANKSISVDLGGRPQRTIIEIAKANGLATGNVTTAPLQDATPAVQVSHVSNRKCEGPKKTSEKCPQDAVENGGRGSITEQLLQTRPDVTLGGGWKYFQETAAGGKYRGLTLEAQAKERGFHIVHSAAELMSVRRADQDEPLLGVFDNGTLPRLWGKEKAVQGGANEPPVKCSPNKKFTDQTPVLGDMTRKAIDLLSQPKRGFFLQVESASIDKAAHSADPCGQIGETVQLSDATTVALEYAKKHKDTLVIVTGDHAQSSQIVGTGVDTSGLTKNLMTADGVPMTVNYGTALKGEDQQHSGVQVRIAAYGPGAANVVGLTDQTDTFFLITDTLGLDRKKK